MLDWLRLEFGIDKTSQKLQDVAHLDADTLAADPGPCWIVWAQETSLGP